VKKSSKGSRSRDRPQASHAQFDLTASRPVAQMLNGVASLERLALRAQAETLGQT
jgi:hypothetical protein